jgi:formylglycine-generating enzyme required for sulfatase activity
MRRWFLSYHSPDQALAERLKAAIERKDSASSVFFAPLHIRAGGFWTAHLAQEIAEADAFILLVGERGLGNWQKLEYDEALDKRVKSPDFALVFVLLEGQTAPGLPFLRRLHWIVTPDPTSEKDIARLFDAASGVGASPGELWRYTAPYRGLSAMEEKDSDYFFGRGRETVEVIRALEIAPGKLPILLGNSGVGKSSLAQAGVVAALKRQAWPEEGGRSNAWPHVFEDSRRWCFLTLKPGAEPLKALVGSFLDTWQFASIDPAWVKHLNDWIELLLNGHATLSDLLDTTERRHSELNRPKVPAFFLYVDQGEELYVRAEERQGRRFSEILAHALPDARLRAMMSMRSDFLGGLQRDEPLFNARRQIDVPPLREGELRTVVSRPAELLSARFDPPGLVDIITRRTAEDSVKDVGALPLLSYTLDDMWTQMVKGGEGVLRLPAASFELGGVLVDRANTFLATHPGAEDVLQRVLTLRLANVHEDGEPTRRHAMRSEFSDREWRLVSELADHPNRLLVTVTPDSGDTYAEVAHEAIFRRWGRLREWIAAEREFLVWRGGLERDRRRWELAPTDLKKDALLMGLALWQAQSWLQRRPDDLPDGLREFVVRSGEVESERQEAARQGEILRVRAEEELARFRAEKEAREQRERAEFEELGRRKAEVAATRARFNARWLMLAVGVLVTVVITGLVSWWEQQALVENFYAFTNVQALTPAQERALEPGAVFKECTDCPNMIVVPAGNFVMGSPNDEKGRQENEGPQHSVAIARPFAASQYELTFDNWDACVDYGGCPMNRSDNGWGRGRRPVINVSWADAQQYVAWLSKVTGQPYRLLAEAEWEYAARAGTTTTYYWGDKIGNANANCDGCGSQWDNQQTAPVGSFAPNAFGLYDTAGNVWQWVQDCYHDNYGDAPSDGSPVTGGECTMRAIRGGSWGAAPPFVRAASRFARDPDYQSGSLGFRVGRTLAP